MRRAQDIWECFGIQNLQGFIASKAATYELIARVILDSEKDRYFIEKPIWTLNSYEWKRSPKPYLTTAAAFKAITIPELLQ